MPTWIRYLLFQVPGWMIAALLLAVLWRWSVLSGEIALACFFGWLAKDLLLYPRLKSAYATTGTSGSEALIGARGVAQGDLAPEGYVRVRGELWRAVAGETVCSGTEVEILNCEGMKVFVRPLNGDPKIPSGDVPVD